MNQERAFQLDVVEEFPHLPAAPIVEAVIHWQARAGKWPNAEELRKRLSERLPDYPECNPQQQLELEARVAANGSSTQIRRDTWHGFRLTSTDKLYIVQFTRDGIVFSRLTPYETWDAFLSKGWQLWQTFLELAEPTEVQRLGVRFINRIAQAQLGDVRQQLSNPPECLESIGLPTGSFLYQSLHEVPGQPFVVNVIRTVQLPTPQQSTEFGLIVDIDVGTTHALACDESVLRDHLSQMHWLKNKVFFNLLSKDAIERFKKGTP